MKSNHTSFTVMGTVVEVCPNEVTFSLNLLTKEMISVRVSNNTNFEVLRNVGDEFRDRVSEPDKDTVVNAIGERDVANDKDVWDAKRRLIKYIKTDLMICIQGVSSTTPDNDIVYYARRIVLMSSEPNAYGWEKTHWWIQQINTLFEQWLDVLFKNKREFTENDFSQGYRTNLDLLGGKTDNSIQECATMSRLLYGLSSSYMLTGNERALSAAKACSRYLINAYANPSHDGEYVFWKFGRISDGKSTKEIITSLNPDDLGTYALYEQIYALSGLTQYYKATQDTLVLGYIIRTIAGFQEFYLDVEKTDDPCFTGNGGYFSHIDPVSMRPDSPALDVTGNRERKNWNSIGDHIPAYLINLLSSIDPLPISNDDSNNSWRELRKLCRNIMDNCVKNILEHFPPEDGCLFVKERFYKDWSFDDTWGWQKDRGIVGHNLKISWNLTRCGNYYKTLAAEMEIKRDESKQQEYIKLAEECYELSRRLGRNMKEAGFDLVRGGIFDALERHPKNGLTTEFAWNSTKDFWQQEQAILAYYIMQNITVDDTEQKDFLQLARYCSAFWNLFFVDHDNRKIYFRTTGSGDPVIAGQYGIQGGHAIAGYHAFELNFLAHIYIRTYVDKDIKHCRNFVLYFKPEKNSGIKTLNVLPDFFAPGDIRIVKIKINGISEDIYDDDQYKFQIEISHLTENSVIMVEYMPNGRMPEEVEKKKKEERDKTAKLEVRIKS